MPSNRNGSELDVGDDFYLYCSGGNRLGCVVHLNNYKIKRNEFFV